MPPGVTVTLVALLAVAALWGMRVGWRRRGRRTRSAVPHLPAVPAPGDPALGAPVTRPLAATYVSSTVAGDWLERVVARDLGVRSAAVVQVFEAGVRIERPGTRDLFVPAGALRGARTAAGMAGKYVGGQGLVVLTWQPPAPGPALDTGPLDTGPLDTGLLDTGLRLRRSADREPLLAAVRALVPAGTDHTDAGPAGASERETA